MKPFTLSLFTPRFVAWSMPLAAGLLIPARPMALLSKRWLPGAFPLTVSLLAAVAPLPASSLFKFGGCPPSSHCRCRWQFRLSGHWSTIHQQPTHIRQIMQEAESPGLPLGANPIQGLRLVQTLVNPSQRTAQKPLFAQCLDLPGHAQQCRHIPPESARLATPIG